MRRKFVFVFTFIFFFASANKAFAVVNPLEKANNKFGIHVFFPSEIYDASKFINSSGGEWGYITAPILVTDRDFEKWRVFMTEAKKHHIIPILRLATGQDLDKSGVWKKPSLTDIIDLANFLNRLPWPIQNRYVIVFNEVNRGDEWGGSVNAKEYANVLSFAVAAFKSKSPDFFVISAGLDNAAPNHGTNYINEYDFMRKMNVAVPGIFYQVDGLASHSYPNPGFSQPPNPDSKIGVASFKYERELAKDLTGKDLPVFITETGWSAEKISDEQKIKYYQETLDSIWNDPGIVAITPFIFDARAGDFEKFSFRTSTGSATAQYNFFANLEKTKGEPAFPVKLAKVLAAESEKTKTNNELHIKQESRFALVDFIKNILNL